MSDIKTWYSENNVGGVKAGDISALAKAGLDIEKADLAGAQTFSAYANIWTGFGKMGADLLTGIGQYLLSSRMIDIQEDYKDIANRAQKDDAALKKEMVEIQEKLSGKAMDLQYKTARIEANTKVQIAKIKKEENVAISEHKAINELFWGRSERYLGSPLSAIC